MPILHICPRDTLYMCAYFSVHAFAAANVDYTASQQTVVISPEQISVNVTVPILEDDIAEAVERVNVFVFSNTPGATSPDFLTSFQIDDNDGESCVMSKGQH